jgi:hypothetical protein
MGLTTFVLVGYRRSSVALIQDRLWWAVVPLTTHVERSKSSRFYTQVSRAASIAISGPPEARAAPVADPDELARLTITEASNGSNPLNLLSHSKGSLHSGPPALLPLSY